MKRGFKGVPRPLLPAMLSIVDPSEGQKAPSVTQPQPSSTVVPPTPPITQPIPSEAITIPVLSQHAPPTPVAETTTVSPSPSPSPSLAHEPMKHTFEQPSADQQPPTPRQEATTSQTKRVLLSDSKEEETKAQGRKTHDLDPLVSLVEEFVTPSKTVNASGEEQVEDISPTTLEAATILTKVQKIKSVDKGKRYKRRKCSKEFASTGLDFEEVKSAFEKVNTGGIKANNHKDQQHCLFACFLSQEEPKKIFDALQDDSWVQAMQEELLQFKLQQVWVLVDLPQGMKLMTRIGDLEKQLKERNQTVPLGKHILNLGRTSSKIMEVALKRRPKEDASRSKQKFNIKSVDKGNRYKRRKRVSKEIAGTVGIGTLKKLSIAVGKTIRLDALEKALETEEVAKQVHLDSLIAQRMAEEQELIEEQKKRKAQVQFEAQSYTEEDWDTIRVKVEANAELKESVLLKDLTVEDYAKRMVELLTQLKKLIFEEVKAEFEKLVKQLDTYVPMNFEATKESLKRFSEELQIKTAKKLKFNDEGTQLTEEKIEEEKDDKPTKKTRKRRKQIARKGFHIDHDKDEVKDSDEANEKDDSTSGTKIPINPVPVATKSPSIANYKIIKQGRKGVYQIVRENGTDMVYISFGAMLTDISRDDLTELYRIVMKKHGMNEPEDEFEKGTLGILEEHSTLFKLGVCKAMLDKKHQGGKPDEDCYKLLKMMEKQAALASPRENGYLVKATSNPLIADDLLKIISLQMSQPANDEFSQHLSDDEASNHEDASDTGAAPKQQQQVIPQTTAISNIKLPILKKEEYDIWAMEMEHYLEYIDNDVWKVIQNGNSKKRISTGKDGVIRILPPVTAAEIQAVEKERKAKNILLMAIPKEHMRRFHGMDDAKEIWEAIRTRFGGNANSKKMQKAVFKQQFEAFTISSSEGLEKGYDRFQQLLSSLLSINFKI
ncbi:hypothetical protein Tco_0179393 [Tanacetum coccineum]